MKIESYSFGKIVIQGKVFTSDVIIYPGGVDAAWWRKEGHLLQVEDLAEALRTKPGVLVIGTGYFGVMRVPRETIERISTLGIDVKMERPRGRSKCTTNWSAPETWSWRSTSRADHSGGAGAPASSVQSPRALRRHAVKSFDTGRDIP